MPRTSTLFALLCLFVAAVGSYGAAFFTAKWIERSSEVAVADQFAEAELVWAIPEADGLQLLITGQAPSEAARFRALAVAGSVVDAGRVVDAMQVVSAPVLSTTPSLEILRNDRGLSLIGLLPEDQSMTVLLNEIAVIAKDVPVANMVDTLERETPEGWTEAVRFAVRALEDLPRSKISVSVERVVISAIVDSEEEKRDVEARLTRRKPAEIDLRLEISAPRPVITPFILRLSKGLDTGTKVEACSAESGAMLEQLSAAAEAAGADDALDCGIGLGMPSTDWPEAALAGITALAGLPGGTLTLSDLDMTLVAAAETDRTVFDTTVLELKQVLPEGVSLETVLTPQPRDPGEEGEDALVPEFIATLSPEGTLQMRGVLQNGDQEAVVLSFARAHFGVSDSYISAQAAERVPPNWMSRVFAGLEALSHVKNGALEVTEQAIEVRGASGDQNASSVVTGVLADRLGQSAPFTVAVRYVEALDPLASLPTPEECLARLNAVLDAQKISFDAGKATVTSESISQLNALAKAFEGCDFVPIEIGGHTDSSGREEMNKGLSQARADTVRNMLIDRGIPPGILTAVGYGEAEPIADNDTEEGREANRRIAFTLRPDALEISEENSESEDISEEAPAEPDAPAEEEETENE